MGSSYTPRPMGQRGKPEAYSSLLTAFLSGTLGIHLQACQIPALPTASPSPSRFISQLAAISWTLCQHPAKGPGPWLCSFILLPSW